MTTYPHPICFGTGVLPNMPSDNNMCWECYGSGQVEDRRFSPRHQRRQAEPVEVIQLSIKNRGIWKPWLPCFKTKDGFIRVQQREALLQRRTEDMDARIEIVMELVDVDKE